jgi:hypothetical protein
MAEQEKQQGFWNSVGGVLTGLAAFFTAITGFIAIVHPFGIGDSKKTPDSTNNRNTICFETHVSDREKFFLGKWVGTGGEFENKGFKNPRKDGFNYKFELEFKVSGDSILMNGIYYAMPKTASTPRIPTRSISGVCIKSGDFLKVLYDTNPLGSDVSKGFGVMVFKFLPSNTEGHGYFASRSARTGELVSGYINLNK